MTLCLSKQHGIIGCFEHEDEKGVSSPTGFAKYHLAFHRCTLSNVSSNFLQMMHNHTS